MHLNTKSSIHIPSKRSPIRCNSSFYIEPRFKMAAQKKLVYISATIYFGNFLVS